MEYQKVLEEQAAGLHLTLTPLERMLHLSSSQKIECCGGEVLKLVTENSADSTVLLRDSSGTCLCALHGEITARYPYASFPGTLLLLRNITIVIVSSNTPPLLIATLENMAGLLLPDDEAATSLAADDSQTVKPPKVPEEGARVSFPFPADGHFSPRRPAAPPPSHTSSTTAADTSAVRAQPASNLTKTAVPHTSSATKQTREKEHADHSPRELRAVDSSEDELEMADEF